MFYTLCTDAARIGVAVEEGIVTLIGCVDTYDQQLKVLRAAGRVGNGRAVACQMQVRLPGPQPLDDSELARTVANVLALNSAVPKNRLRVRVENGWVTLEGKVDWQYQKETAAAALAEVTGVRGGVAQASRRPRTPLAQELGRVVRIITAITLQMREDGLLSRSLFVAPVKEISMPAPSSGNGGNLNVYLRSEDHDRMERR